MYPILALAEVLTEGLVFYRRAVTVYRVGNMAQGVSDALDSILSDDLRHHKSVQGDDAFLWLMGVGLIDQIESQATGTGADRDKSMPIALNALINNTFIMSSPDAKSMVHSYLYALGAEWQKTDEEALAKINQVIDKVGDKFIIDDPVYTIFKELDSIPDWIADKLEALGISKREMQSVLSEFKEGNLAIQWNQALDRAGRMDRPFYKIETAMGVMIAGANSVNPLETTEISFASAVPTQGFFLNTGYMFKEVPILPHHDSIAKGVAITKEETDMMSRKVMESKGFVRTSSGWQKLDETTIKMVTREGEDGKETETPTFVENAVASATQHLADRAENKLSAMARLNRIKKLVGK